MDNAGNIIKKQIPEQLQQQYVDMWSTPLESKKVSDPIEFFSEVRLGLRLDCIHFIAEKIKLSY